MTHGHPFLDPQPLGSGVTCASCIGGNGTGGDAEDAGTWAGTVGGNGWGKTSLLETSSKGGLSSSSPAGEYHAVRFAQRFKDLKYYRSQRTIKVENILLFQSRLRYLTYWCIIINLRVAFRRFIQSPFQIIFIFIFIGNKSCTAGGRIWPLNSSSTA